MASVFKARFDGKCRDCGEPIKTGQPIRWSRRTRGIFHFSCSRPGWHPEIAPDTETETKKDEHAHNAGASFEIQEDTTGEGAPMPDTTTTTKGDAIAEMLAAHVLPLIEDRINVKLNSADVERMVREMLAEREIPRAITVKVLKPETGETTDVGLAHKQFPRLLKLLKAGMHVYLHGAPGAGKSEAARQAAKALGLRFALISLSVQTPPWRIEGFVDAHGVIHDSEFADFFRNGGVFLIDEADNASGNFLTALNSATANGRANFACGTVNVHPDFKLVLTGNTNGTGAHPAFPERRPFDGATRDRFYYVKWEYDTALERAIARTIHPDSEAWVAWVHAARAHVEQHKKRLLVTPRAIYSGLRALVAGESIADVADAVVFRGCADEDRAHILAACPLPRVNYASEGGDA